MSQSANDPTVFINDPEVKINGNDTVVHWVGPNFGTPRRKDLPRRIKPRNRKRDIECFASIVALLEYDH